MPRTFRTGILKIRPRQQSGVIIAPRNKLHCWCCGKEIPKGDLHVFRFSRRLRSRFVMKDLKGIFILCATCFAHLPRECRLRYTFNVHIFKARTPGVDGKEAIYELKELKIGRRICSVTLTAARLYLEVSEHKCTHPKERARRQKLQEKPKKKKTVVS